MACCGSGNKPGQSPKSPIVLGEALPDTPALYARVAQHGQELARGVSAGDQRYFNGTGVEPALEQGMLVDVSAGAVRAKKVAQRHEFAVVIPGETTERFGVWKAAQARARETGGRIEVVPAEKQEA